MRRLGKQRVECLQLLKQQFINHPVSKMWRGYEYQLAEYGLEICREWISRGYKDTCYQKILDLQKPFTDTGLPPWFGNLAFHEAHQSNLIRKDSKHYKPHFPDAREGLPYIYPRR